MADEPQNLILSPLREMRAEMKAQRLEGTTQSTAIKQDIAALRQDIAKRLASLQQAMIGEA